MLPTVCHHHGIWDANANLSKVPVCEEENYSGKTTAAKIDQFNSVNALIH